ncbi:hypothetical protein [Halostella sp. PRR32]|uniref:DUF7475 family protein n=1 Tax=Halostella sp. PRR32 TaxID=3098147 RepID=UPI002B1D2744|nr:hypothetical protein [Halostella sp. PRR32]
MVVESRCQIDVLNWTHLLTAIILAGVHLALGILVPSVSEEQATQFILIGLALLAWPVVYFTSYWRPILYLLGAGFAIYLGSIWFFGGMQRFVVGLLTGVIASVFVLLSVYLFVRESAHTG